MRISDWSSDVCSSDLGPAFERPVDGNGIAGDAGFGPGQQALLAQQLVHQGRLADVGPSDDGELQHALALRRFLLGFGIHLGGRHLDGIREGIWGRPLGRHRVDDVRSEEHTSELQSLMRISYAVFCWKKKTSDNRMK